MSKAVVENIGKLFLMVAVIIVGMSFLMKAFGIDIFGWLQEKFGGLGLEDSKAIFIKLDTDPKRTFEFRLLNSKFFLVDDEAGSRNFKSYFYLSDFPTDKCTLFTAERNGGIAFVEKDDKGGIYYVFPGATLQEGCGGSIKECIDKQQLSWYGCDFREAVESKTPCDTQCKVMKYDSGWKEGRDSCAGQWSYVDCDASGDDVPLYYYNFKKGATWLPSHYNYCDDEHLVAKAKFNEFPNCGDKSKCNLLDKDVDYIKIKFGIICGDDTKWHVCKEEKNSEIKAKVGTKFIDCDPFGDAFVWNQNQIDDALKTVPKPPTVAHIDESVTVQEINQPISLTFTASDENGDLSFLRLNLDDQGDKKGKCEFLSSQAGVDSTGRIVRKDCSASKSTCVATWSITCSQAGIYNFQGQAVDSTSLNNPSNIVEITIFSPITTISGCGTNTNPKEFTIRFGQSTSQNNCKDDHWKVTSVDDGKVSVRLKNVGNIPNIGVFTNSNFKDGRIQPSCNRVGTDWKCEFSASSSTYYIKADAGTGSSTTIEFKLQ